MKIHTYIKRWWTQCRWNYSEQNIAALAPDLQVLFSWGSTVVKFHSRQSLSISFFHVSLGLPAYGLPSAYGCNYWSRISTTVDRGWFPVTRSHSLRKIATHKLKITNCFFIIWNSFKDEEWKWCKFHKNFLNIILSAQRWIWWILKKFPSKYSIAVSLLVVCIHPKNHQPNRQTRG